MIEIKQLSKYYGDVKAVDSIDLSVQKGEVLGLLGPNGAGKSTAMRLLCCYLRPTNGIIWVDGMSILEEPEKVKKKIGYLPESAPLYGDMIVYDYLDYVAGMRNISREKRAEVLRKLASTCAIKEVMHKNVAELSKGYKQRVGLAHALIGDPEILVLDEPTSGLDPNQIVEIRQLIKEIAEQKTIILCSHILSEVEATCDRVVIINKGKVVADGTADGLKESYSSEKVILLELSSRVSGEGPSQNQVEEQLSGIADGCKVESLSLEEDQRTAGRNVLRYHLKYSTERDLRGDVYRLARDKDWPLITLYQQKNSLEHVFRELTQSHVES